MAIGEVKEKRAHDGMALACTEWTTRAPRSGRVDARHISSTGRPDRGPQETDTDTNTNTNTNTDTCVSLFVFSYTIVDYKLK